MKNLLFILVFSVAFILVAGFTLKAKTPEEKDLSCISLLKLAGEKSKSAGEMIKYKNLKNWRKVSRQNIKTIIFWKRHSIKIRWT